MNTPKITIIGAGVSGLSLSQSLALAEWDVTLFEKSRGLGGRLSTRRYGQDRVNHGCNFFQGDQKLFGEDWQKSLMSDLLSPVPGSREEPLWYSRLGNSEWARTLLHPKVNLGFNQTLERIQKQDGLWRLDFADGSQHTCQTLVLTAPIPQSVSLLEAMAQDFPKQVWQSLLGLVYAPCWSLIAKLEEGMNLPFPGYLLGVHPDLDLIADQQALGLSQELYYVVHSGASFSHHLLDASKEQVYEEIMERLSPWVDAGSVLSYDLHRWRYARAIKPLGLPYVQLSESPRLFLLSDGISAGTVSACAEGSLGLASFLDTKN